MNSFDDSGWFKELLDSTTLTDVFAAKALLQRQYFPNVKQHGEELPPIFGSESFSVDAAEAIRDLKPEFAAWVELRTRRFDGLIRRLGIPHPVPYARLVLHIRDHWSELESMLDSLHSQIHPSWHSDGRIIQMDYGDRAEEHREHTRLAQGKNYLVKADISNCFPSIYSHALDWALRGKASAKADKRSRTWQAEVDKYARACVNNETKGLLIGPAVSNLLSELVLQRIDTDLAPATFVRYIDDYSAYFTTRDEAEAFVVNLQRALAVYRLDLNTRKTRIVSLREGHGDAWMAEVLSYLPVERSELAIARFLQQAELLAQRHAGESVLKFAAKTVLGQESALAEDDCPLVVDELARITQFHPHLLSILSHELAKLSDKIDYDHLVTPLLEQLIRAIRGAETDSILWLLYILTTQLHYSFELEPAVMQEMLNLDDDLVWIATAYLVPTRADEVAACIRGMSYVDESDRHSHWLARFEFWRVGLIADAAMTAQELNWMKSLKSRSVAFSGLGARTQPSVVD